MKCRQSMWNTSLIWNTLVYPMCIPLNMCKMWEMYSSPLVMFLCWIQSCIGDLGKVWALVADEESSGPSDVFLGPETLVSCSVRVYSLYFWNQGISEYLCNFSDIYESLCPVLSAFKIISLQFALGGSLAAKIWLNKT